MSRGYRKRRKELQQIVEQIPGFEILNIDEHRNHLCCTIRDDAGNIFKAFTGCTCSSDDRRAYLNFRSDIVRQSNRAKGLVD